MISEKNNTVTINKLPCDSLKGVGPSISKRLAKLGIVSVQDCLFHLPFRYQDRTKITPLRSLRPGMDDLVEGNIELIETICKGRTRVLCRIQDGLGFLTLRFFHFSMMQRQQLSRGTRLRCFGEVRFGPTGYEMVHPEYQILTEGQITEVENTLTPVYPTTEGLHQTTLRKTINQALSLCRNDVSAIQELLPKEILTEFDFPRLDQALFFLHSPKPNVSQSILEEGVHPYQQRLAFEEMLAHHLTLLRLRENVQQHSSIALKPENKLMLAFLQQLPFDLTSIVEFYRR